MTSQELKREYQREYHKKYARKNREQLNANRRKWGKNNPSKINYSRKRKNVDDINKALAKPPVAHAVNDTDPHANLARTNPEREKILADMLRRALWLRYPNDKTGE